MDGWVYVVEAAEKVAKIGWTTEPQERFRRLESSLGCPVYVWALLPGTRRDEERLQENWADLRLHGEYFRAEDELLEAADEGRLFKRRHRLPPKSEPRLYDTRGGQHGGETA